MGVHGTCLGKAFVAPVGARVNPLVFRVVSIHMQSDGVLSQGSKVTLFTAERQIAVVAIFLVSDNGFLKYHGWAFCALYLRITRVFRTVFVNSPCM